MMSGGAPGGAPTDVSDALGGAQAISSPKWNYNLFRKWMQAAAVGERSNTYGHFSDCFFSHQPSCFNGDGMVHLRFLVEECLSEDARLLRCRAYAAELHQVGWMEPRCHLVIFNSTRLVRLQPPLTDSAKRLMSRYGLHGNSRQRERERESE